MEIISFSNIDGGIAFQYHKVEVKLGSLQKSKQMKLDL